MHALGLAEGRDYEIEERYADGDEARLPILTTELLSAGVSIVLATSQPSIIAAARVTKSVPVIGRMVDDPVADGMARSRRAARARQRRAARIRRPPTEQTAAADLNRFTAVDGDGSNDML